MKLTKPEIALLISIAISWSVAFAVFWFLDSLVTGGI